MFSASKRWVEKIFKTKNNVKLEEESIKFTQEDMDKFLNIFNDPIVKDFLSFDICCVFADKYLIAMTFAYFKRANFDHTMYNRFNFFAALFLAHCVEEDDIDLKAVIIPWYQVIHCSINKKADMLVNNKDRILRAIDYRALVSCKSCENIMNFNPDAEVWKRERTPFHTGAYKIHQKCVKCNSPMTTLNPFGNYRYEDDLYETSPSVRRKRQYKEIDSDLLIDEYTDDNSTEDDDDDDDDDDETYFSDNDCDTDTCSNNVVINGENEQ